MFKNKKNTNWKTDKLVNLCLMITDGSHAPPKAREEGFLMISAKNVNNSKISFENPRLLSKDDFEKENKRTNIQSGDVLLTIVGTIGRSAIVADNSPKFTAQRSISVIKPKDIVLSKYIKYFLDSSKSQDFMKKRARGAAQKGIYLKDVKEIEIDYPSIEEQKHIVEKLDKIFEKLCYEESMSNKILEDTESLKKRYLNKLFSEFKKTYKNYTISEIAEIKGGKRLPKGQKLSDSRTKYPYIRVTDFSDKGTIDSQNLKFLNKETQKQIRRYTISSNDLYISIAGTIGKTGIIPTELDGANLTENAAKLVFKDLNKIIPKFIYYHTLSTDFIEQAGIATKTVAQPKLALTRLGKIQIPIPDISTQREVIYKIDKLNKIIESLKKKLLGRHEHFVALKHSLTNQAF